MTFWSINHFVLDTKNEINEIKKFCNNMGVSVSVSSHWEKGGNGAKDLAKKVISACSNSNKNKFKYLYEEKLSLWAKIEKTNCYFLIY